VESTGERVWERKGVCVCTCLSEWERKGVSGAVLERESVCVGEEGCA
jgi:hypothetical protein